MSRPKSPVTVCLLLAGEPLREQPCAKGGTHSWEPNGYDTRYEYAAQLLHTGWRQHRCPACGLWTVWLPVEPNVQPPPLPNPEDPDEPWDLPENVDELGCPDCRDDEEWPTLASVLPSCTRAATPTPEENL